jgi:ADP-ribose pyrophosphatase YjhB (NUDIX family)
MTHRLSAGVLVEDSGHLLVVRHVKPGAYDFWVAPGGGVQAVESLHEAAQREACEETGLDVEPLVLAYIEELSQPEIRHCKFWFTGKVRGGNLSTAAPEAKSEHITEAEWLSKEQLQRVQLFPPVLLGRYWQDREAGYPAPVHLELRHMKFW